MKTIDTVTDDEELPPMRGLTRPSPTRRMPPPPDELPADELPPCPRRSAAVGDLKTRLNCLYYRGRFSQAVDLKLLAATWTIDYVSQVLPHVEGDQGLRLLLAAEAGFLASTELNKYGIRHWERLLEEGRKVRDEFRLR